MNKKLLQQVHEHLIQRIQQDLEERHVGCVVIDTWPAMILTGLLEDLLDKLSKDAKQEEGKSHGA